jgi:dienelactone hydrolase
MDTSDFGHFKFTHDGKTKTVYTRGTGRAVIVCHELGGVSATCLGLADRISSQGFQVFVPVLFGSPTKGSTLRGTIGLCLSREFHTLALDRTSPVSHWLMALAREAETRTGHKGVAAIGMCATGGVVIATLLSDSVRGVVASQPSLPMKWPLATTRRKTNLGMSPEHRAAVEASGKPIMALRFKRDFICPRERLQAVADLSPQAITREVPVTGTYRDHDPAIRWFAHSVLAVEFVAKQGHPTYEAFGEVISFLNQHLQG